jgi:cell division protein FtsI (penicillin-binding protein 3)
MSSRGFYIRAFVSATMLLVALGGLGFRLAFLHLGGHQQSKRAIERTIIAGRGYIFDRKGEGNILAMNLGVKDVCVSPKTLVANETVDEVAALLARNLGRDANKIAQNIRKRSVKEFYAVERYVHEDRIANIQELQVDGVFMQDKTVRYYPQGNFMSHVLGFVNYEGVGSLGVEQRVDSYLRGSPGLLESKVDARRRELYTKRGTYIPAMEGSDVTLTIDQNIQYMVEKALDDVVAKHNPKGAWAIVQRIGTGEILGMASRPSFNLNDFRTAGSDFKLNRAIGVNYEPGSTMKALTIAAALNAGVVTPSTMIDCENGQWFYGGRVLTDGGHSYGVMSVADIIKKSSNIGTAKIALMMGRKLQYEYMKQFGVGDRMGIELPGEEAGVLAPIKKWSKICPTRIAFGQAYSVTALQVLNTFCTIANNGYRMKPYLVKQITSGDGKVVYRGGPKVVNRPIGVVAAKEMAKILATVTESGGTGRRARIDGFSVAGKTGTAQKVKGGTYSAWVGSCVGFVTAVNPQIGVIVVVFLTQGVHAGGVVAAPAFREIVDQTISYLDIQPATWTEVAQR